mgnify:CR=1 FL=1
MSSSELDLKKCLGQTVEISFIKSPIKLKGEIYTVLESKNLMVLVSKKENSDDTNPISHVINLSQVKSIKLIKEEEGANKQNIINVDIEKILDNERRNLSKDMLIKKAETEQYFEKGLTIYEQLSMAKTIKNDKFLGLNTANPSKI